MSIPQFTASKIGEDRLMLFCQDKVLEFPQKAFEKTRLELIVHSNWF